MRCFVRASVPGAFQVKGRSWASAISAARSTFGRARDSVIVPGDAVLETGDAF